MKYTTLPSTDVKVSKICLGTMTWGNQNTEADGHEQMDYALDQGVNFLIQRSSMQSLLPKKPMVKQRKLSVVGSRKQETEIG